MEFIDWSDAGGMFDLLLDLVAGEEADCPDGSERQLFLADLLEQLRGVESRFPEVAASQVIQDLKDIHDSVDTEFASDRVVDHLRDCIVELERVEGRAP